MHMCYKVFWFSYKSLYICGWLCVLTCNQDTKPWWKWAVLEHCCLTVFLFIRQWKSAFWTQPLCLSWLPLAVTLQFILRLFFDHHLKITISWKTSWLTWSIPANCRLFIGELLIGHWQRSPYTNLRLDYAPFLPPFCPSAPNVIYVTTFHTSVRLLRWSEQNFV